MILLMVFPENLSIERKIQRDDGKEDCMWSWSPESENILASRLAGGE